jgi:hypothetical protein
MKAAIGPTLAIAPIVRVKSILVFPPIDFILKDDYTLEVYLNIRINSSELTLLN